jgi:hypothetical protein
MNFIINEEFAGLIPPLSGDELHNLEQSLLKEGCRDPLVVWHNTIIDGHHRYAICSKHGISFNIIEKPELETELDVKLWMINNQFSRRNLPTETRLALAYRFKELEAQKAKERMQATQFKEIDNTASTPVYTPQINEQKPENTEKGRALEAIAKKAGVSHTTAFQYDKIQQQGTEEQKAEVAEGKSSIKKVYTQIQKSNRLESNKDYLKLPCDLIVIIQQHITNIYNVLDGYHSSKDFREIYYWSVREWFRENDEFHMSFTHIARLIKLVTRQLNQLSESVDDLEIRVNKCKQLIILEKDKNENFARRYNKYHSNKRLGAKEWCAKVNA